MRATYVRRLVTILKSVGLVVDRGDWLVPDQVLACYLVRQGLSAAEAIERVRAVRPGSIETRQQVQAVHTYEQMLRQQVPSP